MLRMLRVTLVPIGTCGVLLGGAWAGGAFQQAFGEPGAPARVRVADAYPARSAPGEIRIGDTLNVNGQRMQLSAFTTSDPPARVAEFYADAFSRRGLLPVAVAEERLGHVSVFDPEDGLQRFVTAIPERAGQTLVLLGVTDPRGFRLVRSASDAPYPVPEEHRAFLGYASEDGTTRAHSAQFVSGLSAAEVSRFYRARLEARGFSERRPGGPGLLEFAKGTEQISVALQSLTQDRGAAVFVTRVEGAP
jgi:hypothetical protein